MFFHFNSYLYYDRFVDSVLTQIICASALFLACKIFDSHLEMQSICASHHKVYRKCIKHDDLMLDEKIIETLREKICIAESVILKTLKYNLNFEMPYPYLDELVKKYFKESNKDVYYISRMILLDVFRSGASLFYHHTNLTLAAVIFAMKLTTSTINPLHYQALQAVDYSGLGNEPTIEQKKINEQIISLLQNEQARKTEPAKQDLLLPEKNSDEIVNELQQTHQKDLEPNGPATLPEAASNGEPPTANPIVDELNANEMIVESAVGDPEKLNETDNLKKVDGEPTIEGSGLKPEEKKKKAEETAEKEFTIPEIFPLGLEMKGVGYIIHPTKIDENLIEDKYGEELFIQWIRELDNPNINLNHIFGRFPLT
jgi:hypothetical protein